MAQIIINTDNLFQRALEAVGLTTKAASIQEASKSYAAGYYDGNDEPPSGTLASYGYNRATSHGLRDFTKMTPDKILNVAWILFQSNQVAGRYFEVVRDHIIGDGVTYTVDDDDLRDIFDAFWKRNKLNIRLKKFTVELRLWGEQCYPVFVRKSDGRVTLAYIDPGEIERVITHPANALEAWAVVLKKDTRHIEKRCYRIIRHDEGYVDGNRVITPNYEDKLVTHEQARLEPWETVLLAQYGLSQYTGSCFYFSVNNVSNQPRGFSDLVRAADWLDADDSTLFALADREQQAGYFSWDVTVTGANDEAVKAKAAEIRKRVPKKGQANVHNENEVWEMKAPDLKQQASIATSETLIDRTWGMFGLPKHWRGVGESANRASAGSMDEPTRKSLAHKQDVQKTIVVEFLSFVRDQAEIAGAYSGKERDFEVEMPELVGKDIATAAQTLTQLTGALTVARDELKVITNETTAKAVAKAMAELGIDYDAVEELKAAEKEQAERDKEQEQDDQATADKAQQWLQQNWQQNGQQGVNGINRNQVQKGNPPNGNPIQPPGK